MKDNITNSVSVPKDGYVSREDFSNRTALGDDQDAAPYPEDNETVIWISKELSKLRKQGQCSRLLDIGCGHGRWAFHLESLYDIYLGLDPVEQRIESARKLWGKDGVDFACIDTSKPWSVDGHKENFDVIILVDVLQHLGLNEANSVITNSSSHLRPNGRFIIWDGRIGRYSAAQAEAMYAKDSEHMIPKPLSLLMTANKDLTWYGDGCTWTVVKLGNVK